MEKDSSLTTIKWIETTKLDSSYEKNAFFFSKASRMAGLLSNKNIPSHANLDLKTGRIPKARVVFQPSIFQVQAISFREGHSRISSIFRFHSQNSEKNPRPSTKKKSLNLKQIVFFPPKNKGIRDTSKPPVTFRGPLRSLNPHEPLPWDRLYQQAQARPLPHLDG